MKFIKILAMATIALSLSVSMAAAQSSMAPAMPGTIKSPNANQPAAAPSVSVKPPAAPSANANQPAAAPSVKPVSKTFLLSKPTAIYSAPDTSSTVLEHVHGGIHVHVTGITGNWLRLKLRTGKTGYIPAKAAE
ncbi:MAG: SH3 domain-containing protein [Candidatus Binataceae bacterium]